MIPGYYESIRYPADTGILFRVMEYQQSYYTAPHWHNGIELVYISQGKETFFFSNKRYYTLTSGDFLLANSQEIHSVRVDQGCRELLLQIPYAFIRRHITDLDRIQFDCIHSRETLPENSGVSESAPCRHMAVLLQELTDSYPLTSAADQLHFFSLIYQLLFYLEHDFRIELGPEQKSASSRYMERLGQITSYVKEHYAEDLTLREISRQVSLNPDYFTRFFKKYMGMTFLDYLNSIRLEHIAKDLLQTDLSIQELLNRHGFTNYRLFMKMYRSRFGCTPGVMRKQKVPTRKS